ncbi:MAG: hypothetical protein FWG37_03515 [Clostridia bacterium]|nr:hypothetical protein [Clostridia bacterium]
MIGIPRIVSPDMLTVLMEMGHGDSLVIGDANFPAHSVARASGGRAVRADAARVSDLLDAILTLMPLDDAVHTPILGMVDPSCALSEAHETFQSVLARHGYDPERMALLSKADFYQRAAHSYAILASGDPERFANLILTKGVVTYAKKT